MTPDMQATVRDCLLKRGPDIVVCDEAHKLKNADSQLYKAVDQLRTARRILLLTGTPIQNALLEYYAMINLVKPNLLGTLEQFEDYFVKPIKEGQDADSNEEQVLLMKKRVYVLHRLVEGIARLIIANVKNNFILFKCSFLVNFRLHSSSGRGSIEAIFGKQN